MLIGGRPVSEPRAFGQQNLGPSFHDTKQGVYNCLISDYFWNSEGDQTYIDIWVLGWVYPFSALPHTIPEITLGDTPTHLTEK